MEDVLTVRRWRRYGADRLFVTQESGARVGSVDLQSGEVVVDDPQREAGLRRAAQAYLRADVAELAMSLPTPGVGALDPVDESALQAWLGGDDWDTINLDGSAASAAAPCVRASSVWATRAGRSSTTCPLGRQGSMVEHLLIGPAGIFTVAERRHPGQRVVVEGRTIAVDGRSMSYLRDARLEATRVQGALLAAACAAITVRGVVVVHGDLEVRTVQPQHDAFAIARQDVQTVFRAMPVRLDPARIMAIAHVARQRTTWSR